MDKAEYVRHRRAKYMAQTLEALEELVIITMDVPNDAARDYREARDRPPDANGRPQADRSAFQRHVEPHLAGPAVVAIRDFKGLVRARFNALANNATDVMALGDVEINGAAMEIRDRLSPIGRP